MKPLSKKQFQTITGIGVFFLFLGYYAMAVEMARPPREVAGAFEWMGRGARVSDAGLAMISSVQLGGYLVGFIGFLAFLSWGRYVLLGSVLFSIAILPVAGVSVAYGLSNLIYSVGSCLVVIPLVLSFFEPCSGYFRKGRVGTPGEEG